MPERFVSPVGLNADCGIAAQAAELQFTFHCSWTAAPPRLSYQCKLEVVVARVEVGGAVERQRRPSTGDPDLVQPQRPPSSTLPMVWNSYTPLQGAVSRPVQRVEHVVAAGQLRELGAAVAVVVVDVRVVASEGALQQSGSGRKFPLSNLVTVVARREPVRGRNVARGCVQIGRRDALVVGDCRTSNAA